MKDKFMVKGTLAYAYDAKQGLMCYTNETTIAEMAGQYSMPIDVAKAMYAEFHTRRLYDLMDGLDFLKQVESGCITDYDGNLSNVFVDGYDSNLGLICGGFGQGQFCVTRDTFRELCMNHDIKVNWANK